MRLDRIHIVDTVPPFLLNPRKCVAEIIGTICCQRLVLQIRKLSYGKLLLELENEGFAVTPREKESCVKLVNHFIIYVTISLFQFENQLLPKK